MSGAEKAVKDLEQLAAADPEALIDSIEELLPAVTSQAAEVATGVSTGLVTGLADPVLSKGNGSLAQGGGDKPAVKCGVKLLHCCAARQDVAPQQCLYAFALPSSTAFSPDAYPKQCLFPFCLPFWVTCLKASNFPLLVALRQARKLFDAVQTFVLLQHSPVNKGFQ